MIVQEKFDYLKRNLTFKTVPEYYEEHVKRILVPNYDTIKSYFPDIDTFWKEDMPYWSNYGYIYNAYQDNGEVKVVEATLGFNKINFEMRIDTETPFHLTVWVNDTVVAYLSVEDIPKDLIEEMKEVYKEKDDKEWDLER